VANNDGTRANKKQVRQYIDYFLADPRAKLKHLLFVARGTEVTPLARERQKTLVGAIPALDPGKAVVQIATVKIPIDNLCHIWTEKAILPLKPIFINFLKGLKVVFYALVVR
jgi:hypothetical protein